MDRLLRRAFAGLHVATVGLVLGTQAMSCAKTAERLIASRSGAIREPTLEIDPGLARVEAHPTFASRAEYVTPRQTPPVRRNVLEAPSGSVLTTD